VMVGRAFSDVVQFRSPPPPVQKVLFTVLAPLAHALGYRGTYPKLSRSIAPHSNADGPTLTAPTLDALTSV
jgi:hypothetical protein